MCKTFDLTDSLLGFYPKEIIQNTIKVLSQCPLINVIYNMENFKAV